MSGNFFTNVIEGTVEAKEKLIPIRPSISGNRPVMQRGQIPTTNPPRVPAPAKIFPSLHFFLSLYKI